MLLEDYDHKGSAAEGRGNSPVMSLKELMPK
jgi:hypothetical protein